MSSADGYLDLVRDTWGRRTQSSKWKEDPVLWAEEYLGIHPWAKQREILYAIRDCRQTAVAAGHGVGKDLALDTPLPTPTGWTTMGEVQPGDYLLDETGTPTMVLTKSEVFTDHELYEVTFSDGAKIVASNTHLWNTIDFNAGKSARRGGDWSGDWRDYWDISDTRDTDEIRNALTKKNGRLRASNHVIPINMALDLPEADLPIHPYILGAWLGDGTSSGVMMTVGNDSKYVIDEFSAVGVELTQMVSDARGYAYTFARQGYREKLREIGVLNNKHIPDRYLRASSNQRMELLRGIMDTDGFAGQGRSVGVDFANEQLARDVAELVRTLGVKVNVRPGNMYLGSEIVGTRYRLAFTPNFNPFTAGSYKSDSIENAKSARDPRTTARSVVSIERVKTVPTQCVTVDSPRSLYLAGEEMVVTHNTFIVAVAACWWIATHPIGEKHTFVASTAPSADQVNLLWGEIRSLHLEAQLRHERGVVDQPLPGYINGKNMWMWNKQTIGQGRKPPDQKSDVAFQGRHATYLLAIGDEAVGLSKGFIGALGAIATGKHCRRILIANPTDPNSHMASIWREQEDAINAGRELDEDTVWKTMHISVMDSPHIKPEPGYEAEKWAPALSGWEYVKQALQEYGSEEDPQYIARVLGNWAFDQGDNVFSAEDIAHGHNTIVVVPDDAVVELGADIARSERGDYSAVYKMERGTVWKTDEVGNPIQDTGRPGFRLRRVDRWRGAPVYSENPDKLGSTQRVHNLMLEEGGKIVKVDAAGIGKGVIDGLSDMERHGMVHYTYFEVYGSNPTISMKERRTYANIRAEQFFRLKRLLRDGYLDIDPQDDHLAGELMRIAYDTDGKGRIKIEGKDDMRKRGVKSPDHADAAWYAMLDISGLLDPMSQMKEGSKVLVDPEVETYSGVFSNTGFSRPI